MTLPNLPIEIICMILSYGRLIHPTAQLIKKIKIDVNKHYTELFTPINKDSVFNFYLLYFHYFLYSNLFRLYNKTGRNETFFEHLKKIRSKN
jgi:hypothetical protein